MIINTTVYGAENTWLNAPLANANNGDWQIGQVPNFGDNDSTLQKGNTTGKTPINQHIDKSLSWCALGQESNYCKLSIYDKDGNTTIHRSDENLNFFFWQRYNINSVGQLQTSTIRNNANNMLWSPITQFGTNSTHRYISPFTNFYINKIIWVIYVRAATDTTLASIFTYTYADYVANHKVDHPVIMQIYAEPYIYRTVSANRQNYNSVSSISSHPNTVISLGLFTEYNIPNTGSSTAIDYACFDGDRTTNLILFGKRNDSDNMSNTMYKYAVSVGNVKNNGNSAAFKVYQDDNIDDVLEGALKTIACFGFYFVFDTSYVNDDLDSTNVYMGVIPESGITHGEYTHGAANRENPNWSWTGTKDSTYDYTKPVTNYDNNSPFNSLSIAAFNKMYAIQKQTAGKLAKVLSNGILSRPAGTPIDEWLNDTFLTSNPLDTIVSLKKFPMSVLSGADFTAEKIYFGAYSDDNITGIPYTLNPPYRIYTTTFTGENMFKPEFGDSFLDYEPFTNVSLYLPFCGTVKIPVAEFMGHDINITYTIDLISGSVAAYVRRDNLNILSAQGTCAIDIPVSGIQGATLDSQIFQSSQNLRAAKSNEVFAKTAAFGSALNVAQSKSYTGVLSTIGSEGRRLENATLARQGAEYELSHIELPLKQVGGASPLTSQLAEFNCRLIIERPVLSPDYDPEVYADTVGFACLINGKVSDFTGLTEASINLDSVNCTADEKKMISSAFANGVYL